MGLEALAQVLRELPKPTDPNILVGVETSDDAAVYRIAENLATVATLDFFPPIVDDAFSFGEISAANSLSDVYAMGGEPKYALSIVCFPKELPLNILTEILKGASAKLKEAGVSLVGGHSIEDKEVKFGLSVTGVVEPAKAVKNVGAKSGDALILTKPVGVGIITSALKGGALKIDSETAKEALASMKTLNKDAALAMQVVGVNACTDVTGFGLLGHAYEMAEGSGVSFIIDSKAVRVFDAALELVKNKKNRPRAISTTSEFLKAKAFFAPSISEELRMLFADPQTSGGLLISVSADKKDALLAELEKRGVKAFVIGHAAEKSAFTLEVR